MAKKRKRGNGQGTLYKKNGKNWHASWYDHLGKRHSVSTETTDKAAAERILAKHVTAKALRNHGVIDARSDVYAKEARRPISDHLKDYAVHLKTRCGDGHTTTTT